MKRNRFGGSGLERKIRVNRLLLRVVFPLMMLSACAGINPVPVEDREVETRVRTPASQESEGVQVFPLQNPAVQKLLADAGSAETAGNYTQAAVLLERALRIQPRDPEVLQQMAEIQLQKQDFQQALNFAVRSYEIGPRVGEICDRNWRTISVAREHLGDANGSAQAEQKALVCMNTKPRSL